MQNRVYLSPTTDNGVKTLLDKSGKKFKWPKTGANKRLCDVALKNGNAVKVLLKDGELKYGTAKIECFSNGTAKETKVTMEELLSTQIVEAKVDIPAEQAELMNFIKTSMELKPEVLKMAELKWKYLIRSAMRGKNIMMTGPSGCGKTMAAKSLVNVLDRPDYYFNLGATQDPRSTLIGNTHFNKEDGTFFQPSLFVEAIQTENAVILLDELSRAHPDAHNILMTVLDEGQRYLRLDEAPDSPTIKVADGVTFVATANIGNEYTATRVMDRALLDRFIIVEMEVLNEEEEINLLKHLYPQVDTKAIESIANIVSGTRIELNTDNPRISTHISTRASVEMAGLIYDGFKLEEAAEVIIYPQFDSSGGVDSERTFVKQLVQKHIVVEGQEELAVDDELFDQNDMDS
jgi:nitric oxide reductase NorQ protein